MWLEKQFLDVGAHVEIKIDVGTHVEKQFYCVTWTKNNINVKNAKK